MIGPELKLGKSYVITIHSYSLIKYKPNICVLFLFCSEPTHHCWLLPIKPSPSGAHTGPVKTGGRIFVLDHKRWPASMKAVIDGLLNKHRRQKNMLKLVGQEFTTLVHNSSTDPNSLLCPSTKIHISQYIKHISKLLNTSSSQNISPKKLEETQTL